MTKTVVLVGALDTKGQEFAFVKDLIEQAGLRTLVVDFGVMGGAAFPPDVSRDEVAAAGGGDLAHLASGERKDEAMRVMAEGLAVVVRRLYDEGRLDGTAGGVRLGPEPDRPLHPEGVARARLLALLGWGTMAPCPCPAADRWPTGRPPGRARADGGHHQPGFRRLCRESGAGIYVSEMITLARSCSSAPTRRCDLIRFDADESPRSLQLYGVDPVTIGAAVRMLVDEDLADHIDLNFGCPVPKVTRKGGGSALPWKRTCSARWSPVPWPPRTAGCR